MIDMLLGDQRIPIIFGGFSGPILTGTLSPTDPAVFGSLVDELFHDLVLVDGNLSPTGDLAQRIDCLLRTFRGEWWLDPSIGVPWLDEVLKKNPDLQVIRQLLISIIMTDSEAASVSRMDLELDRITGTLGVSFDLQSVDKTTVSGQSEVFA